MKVTSAEARALHAVLDGEHDELIETLDNFTDWELWELQSACMDLAKATGNIILERLQGNRERPQGFKAIGGTSS